MTWSSTLQERPGADSKNGKGGTLYVAPTDLQHQPVPDPPPGFTLLEEVGRGGMGIVYRAHDLDFDREIALKFLQQRYLNNRIQTSRFLEEARITGQLQHPGIPAVHQTGKLLDGTPYLVMKLIKGYTLGEKIWKGKSASTLTLGEPYVIPNNYLSIFESICQAIGYAHAHGVVHRDLKPQNIMVGAFGEVQVMDWGLAKHLNKSTSDIMLAPSVPEQRVIDSLGEQCTIDHGLTTAGTVVGTPAYMAPEQSAGNVPIDARADVFGLGAILCCMLTGQPPFDDKNSDNALMQSAMGLVQGAFDRMDSSGADSEIINLAKRCMSANRNERPLNGEAVAQEVAQIRADADKRAQQAELERAKTLVHAQGLQHRRRLLQVIVAILFLGIVGAIIAIVHISNKEQMAIAKEAETNAVLDFFMDEVFSAARPLSTEMGLGRNVTMQEVMLASRAAMARKFKDKPITEAMVRYTMARSFEFLGEPSIALEDFERCLLLREKNLGNMSIDTIQARLALANIYDVLEQHDKAHAARELAYQHARQEFGLASHTTQMAMNNLANSYDRLRRTDDAINLREQVLSLTRQHLGERNPFTLLCMNNLGYSYACLGQYKRGLALLDEALELQDKYLKTDHAVKIDTLNSKAECFVMMKQPEKAMPIYLSILETRRTIEGDDHPGTLACMLEVSKCYVAMNQNLQAYQHAIKALPLFEKKLTDRHSKTMECLFLCIDSLHALMRDKEALPCMQRYIVRSRARNPEQLSKVYSYLCQYHCNSNDVVSFEQTMKSWEDRQLSGFKIQMEQARCWFQLAGQQQKTNSQQSNAAGRRGLQLIQMAVKSWLVRTFVNSGRTVEHLPFHSRNSLRV